MADEIMNQVKNNYKNFEDAKKRVKEPASEDTVQKSYEPGERFKRVFSGMIGNTQETPPKASAPERNDEFNKRFSSIVGRASVSGYSSGKPVHVEEKANAGGGAIIEAPTYPAKPIEVKASTPSMGQPSVFERLYRQSSEEPSQEPKEQAVEASPVKEEPAPVKEEPVAASHRMSVFERLSKHKA